VRDRRTFYPFSSGLRFRVPSTLVETGRLRAISAPRAMQVPENRSPDPNEKNKPRLASCLELLQK
jgi:hypothetical protein